MPSNIAIDLTTACALNSWHSAGITELSHAYSVLVAITLVAN